MKHFGKIFAPVAFAVLLSVTIVIPSGADDRPLTVVSWGGSYAQACVKGYHERFTAQTGIAINLEDYNGGLAQIRAQVDVGNVFWDVVDLEIADLVVGCDEGLLVPVDVESFPARATWKQPGGSSGLPRVRSPWPVSAGTSHTVRRAVRRWR